jgi:hypothetical protein
MRALATCIVALFLAASPLVAKAAGTGANGNPSTTEAKNSAAPAQPGNASAADPKANAAATAQPSSSELESELQELRDLLESQSRQIQEQQQKMQMLEEELNSATSAKDGLGADSASSSAAIAPVAAAVATGKDSAQGGTPEEPPALRYKGITLTPGGFMAAETVWRQKALGSDVNSNLGAIPFNGSSNAHMSEFQASGRQSRISMLVEGKLADVKIGGYYETDFLSAGTTSNPNQSNSYTLRQRQFWGQAAFNNGFTFTGGQQWSLLTETAKGMDNRTENLPMTIDAQYHIGFSWARQYGARITKNFNNKVWLGLSVEESQPNSVGVHGQPTAQAAATPVCTNAGCTTTTTINLNPTFNNYLLGQFGAGGGLYNPVANYGYNYAPDFIVKAVFEPGFGHYEVFGLLTEFHDRIFPCVPITGTTPPAGCSSITSAQFAHNDEATGGGVGANARWNVLNKKVDLGIHFFGGAGIGRYGSGGLADLTVRPDGTLVPLHNFQTLGTLQFHPNSKLDIYLNVGGEFEERAQYIKSGAVPNEGYGAVGFSNSGCLTEVDPLTGPATNTNLGVPTGVGGGTGFIPGPLGSCTGDTRNLLEGTLGFWYRFYQGPKGRFQFGMQYSNVDRNTWRGNNTLPVTESIQPHGDENMVFTSFRYYLP